MVTVTFPLMLPPPPVQARGKVGLVERAPVETEPEVDLLPLHPPPARQEFALVEDQESVAEPPEATLGAFDVRMTVGAGGITTVEPDTFTTIFFESLPPAP